MLELHSLLRYVVLLLLVVAIIKAFGGWFGKKNFTAGDAKTGLFLMIFSHIQLVLGLALYFTSDMMKAVLSAENAMSDPILRFWKVEHLTGMVVAIILITIGRSRAKKASNDHAKHRLSAIFYTLAFVLIMLMIPWAERGWNPF